MRATPEEQQFHQRILAGNSTAFAEFAETFYNDLVRAALSRAGPSADPVLVEEAMGLALLAYNDAPERYDPLRSSLQTYLITVAYRDFQNERNKENRRTRGQVLLPDVSLTDEYDPSASDDFEALLIRLRAEEVWPYVDQAFREPTERQVLLLIMNGVRETAPYAKVLRIDHLSQDEQTQHVNRVKNRIKKRLRRIGEKLDE